MTKLQCPNVVAAAIKLEEHKQAAEGKDLWTLADALVKDCTDDEPSSKSSGRSGAHNGSKATLEIASKELAASDLEYTPRTLESIRNVAISFKRADRVEGLAFWSHAEAGNPEIMAWIMKTTPKRKQDRWGIISVTTIREKAQQYRQIAKEAKEREHAKAKAVIKDDSASFEDKRKAKEKADALEGMPKTGAGSYKPSDSELRSNANTMKIDTDLSGVLRTLQDAMRELRTIKNINEDYAASFVEECDKIIAATLHIKNFLEGNSNVRKLEGKHA